MIKLFRKLIYCFIDSRLWYFILKNIPKIRLSTGYTKLPGQSYSVGYDRLRPGDIILSVDNSKLTSIFIKGEWSHAGVCVDKGVGKLEIAEMTRKDFQIVPFYTFCKESDRIAILRVEDENWSEEYKRCFIAKVLSFKDAAYNHTFRSYFNPKRKFKPMLNKDGKRVKTYYYCSQMITEGDYKDVLDISWEDIKGLGISYISPSGLSKGKNICHIFDSKGWG